MTLANTAIKDELHELKNFIKEGVDWRKNDCMVSLGISCRGIFAVSFLVNQTIHNKYRNW